ncbi:MAG TPA: DUF3450 family protein [Xanthomonadales bacterium]|nr:DUF3450 family protein [Xanthomonadales bacterium]
MISPSVRALLALALAATTPAAAAQDESTRLAQSLIALRGEVEQVNGELELLRAEQRTTLQGLAAQKAELSAQLERQQLQLGELEARLLERNAAAAQSVEGSDSLAPVLLEASSRLRNHVASSLPFKTEERLAALAEIEQQLRDGTLAPTRAANRLWAYVEDELRLTRESGLHQQTVALGDERVLAQVAKLGSMLLFYRTEDGRVGRAARTNAGWRFEPIDDEANRQRVAALFDALGKQIRQGWFELPYGATAGG